MIHGFYLVDKRRANVDEEVRLFRQAMVVDVDPLHFEDIVPIVGPGDDDGILMTSGERLPRPDFVFTRAFRLTDEESYQMKAVLRMLEGMGVLCINPAECKDITADKLRTFQVARAVIPEIPVPKTMLITPGVDTGLVAEYIGFPAVLKVLHGEGGTGVVLLETEGELRKTLSMVKACKPGDQVIVQQAIMTSRGRDLRIIVLGDSILRTMVRSNPTSFTSNVHRGGEVLEYDPPEHVKNAAVRLAKAIGIRLGSVDFLFGEKEGEFYLCEANSSIGLVPEAGIDPVLARRLALRLLEGSR